MFWVVIASTNPPYWTAKIVLNLQLSIEIISFVSEYINDPVYAYKFVNVESIKIISLFLYKYKPAPT